MDFGQLKTYDKFTITEEPESLFYKDSDRYDGAINAYRIRGEYKDNILEPVIFGKNNKIKKQD